MATQYSERLLTVAEFLRIDFGPDMKAELDNGIIRMMAGGTLSHARVQMNFYRYLGNILRGSGCRPFGSDAAVATHDRSVRYPDVTVDCGGIRNTDEDRLLSNPRVVVEILSPSTRRQDEGVKLAEYRAVPSVDTIVLVDPDAERCRVLQRTGPSSWTDTTFTVPSPIALPSIGVTIPHEEIFARD